MQHARAKPHRLKQQATKQGARERVRVCLQFLRLIILDQTALPKTLNLFTAHAHRRAPRDRAQAQSRPELTGAGMRTFAAER